MLYAPCYTLSKDTYTQAAFTLSSHWSYALYLGYRGDDKSWSPRCAFL